MVSFDVMGVPTSAGAYGVGQEQAPRALRDGGLLPALADKGVDVADRGDLPVTRFTPDPSSRNAQNLPAVVNVAGDVATKVEQIVREGRVPLVLGGDCTITLGVVAGLVAAGEEVALAYVDGDLDLSTPTTTRSGVLDAMGVAHMLDLQGASSALAAIGGRRPLLPGPKLAMVGYEDIDAREQAILDRRGVHLFPAAELRAHPVEVARSVHAAVGDAQPLIVHFDVDALDSIDSPLAHYPHFNTGASLDQVTACLRHLCRDAKLAAFVVTEVNPLHDPDGVYVPRLVEAIADVLGSAVE